MLYKVTYDLVATPASTASEPVRSFSDAGMKLVYLIFCDDMVLNEKKKQKKKKKKQTYNIMSTDREVLIKAKHGG